METVFDHNITQEEWLFVRGMDKERYLSRLTEAVAIRDIASLYYHRGKRKKAEYYINKLGNINAISSFWRTMTHP